MRCLLPALALIMASLAVVGAKARLRLGCYISVATASVGEVTRIRFSQAVTVIGS
jgi:hypothetical protein